MVFGGWSHALVGWAMLDSLIEVRFLLWFHEYEWRFWEKVVKAGSVGRGNEDGGRSRDKVKDLRDAIWWVPTWRFAVLKVVVGAWVAVMLPLFWT